jgi:hypothetical protein
MRLLWQDGQVLPKSKALHPIHGESRGLHSRGKRFPSTGDTASPRSGLERDVPRVRWTPLLLTQYGHI